MGNKNTKLIKKNNSKNISTNSKKISFYKNPFFWFFIILVIGGGIAYYLLTQNKTKLQKLCKGCGNKDCCNGKCLGKNQTCINGVICENNQLCGKNKNICCKKGQLCDNGKCVTCKNTKSFCKDPDKPCCESYCSDSSNRKLNLPKEKCKGSGKIWKEMHCDTNSKVVPSKTKCCPKNQFVDKNGQCCTGEICTDGQCCTSIKGKKTSCCPISNGKTECCTNDVDSTCIPGIGCKTRCPNDDQLNKLKSQNIQWGFKKYTDATEITETKCKKLPGGKPIYQNGTYIKCSQLIGNKYFHISEDNNKNVQNIKDVKGYLEDNTQICKISETENNKVTFYASDNLCNWKSEPTNNLVLSDKPSLNTMTLYETDKNGNLKYSNNEPISYSNKKEIPIFLTKNIDVNNINGKKYVWGSYETVIEDKSSETKKNKIKTGCDQIDCSNKLQMTGLHGTYMNEKTGKCSGMVDVESNTISSCPFKRNEVLDKDNKKIGRCCYKSDNTWTGQVCQKGYICLTDGNTNIGTCIDKDDCISYDKNKGSICSGKGKCVLNGTKGKCDCPKDAPFTGNPNTNVCKTDIEILSNSLLLENDQIEKLNKECPGLFKKTMGDCNANTDPPWCQERQIKAHGKFSIKNSASGATCSMNLCPDISIQKLKNQWKTNNVSKNLITQTNLIKYTKETCNSLNMCKWNDNDKSCEFSSDGTTLKGQKREGCDYFTYKVDPKNKANHCGGVRQGGSGCYNSCCEQQLSFFKNGTSQPTNKGAVEFAYARGCATSDKKSVLKLNNPNGTQTLYKYPDGTTLSKYNNRIGKNCYTNPNPLDPTPEGCDTQHERCEDYTCVAAILPGHRTCTENAQCMGFLQKLPGNSCIAGLCQCRSNSDCIKIKEGTNVCSNSNHKTKSQCLGNGYKWTPIETVPDIGKVCKDYKCVPAVTRGGTCTEVDLNKDGGDSECASGLYCRGTPGQTILRRCLEYKSRKNGQSCYDKTECQSEKCDGALGVQGTCGNTLTLAKFTNIAKSGVAAEASKVAKMLKLKQKEEAIAKSKAAQAVAAAARKAEKAIAKSKAAQAVAAAARKAAKSKVGKTVIKDAKVTVKTVEKSGSAVVKQFNKYPPWHVCTSHDQCISNNCVQQYKSVCHKKSIWDIIPKCDSVPTNKLCGVA